MKLREINTNSCKLNFLPILGCHSEFHIFSSSFFKRATLYKARQLEILIFKKEKKNKKQNRMLIRNCTFIQIPLVKIKVLLSITCHHANIYMHTKLLQNATQNYKAMLLYTQQRIAKRAYLLYHQAILHVTENKQYYSHSSSDPQGHMHIRTLKKKTA